jgi:Domain of unknown function (DUF4411)
MTYAFDNSPLSVLFRNFYRNRFPTLWRRFDALVAGGEVLSTREVMREIEDGPIESLRTWAGNNEQIFSIPTAEEGAFVAEIFAIDHFQQNIERQKLLKGGHNADPFIVARAAVADCPVVTMEQLKPNSAKIPNICEHFDIECLTLEQFMEREGWQF